MISQLAPSIKNTVINNKIGFIADFNYITEIYSIRKPDDYIDTGTGFCQGKMYFSL